MYQYPNNVGWLREHGIALVVAMSALWNGSCFFGSEVSVCEITSLNCPPGYACTADKSACIPDRCGNGIRDTEDGEICDDGNIRSGDGCGADCKSNEKCGNGTPDEAAGETCDDGNTAAGDGCSSKCTLELCGDGHYDPASGEQCDTGGDTQACDGNGRCLIPRCGDGYVNSKYSPSGPGGSPEICDDGNALDCGTCAVGCTQVSKPEALTIQTPSADFLNSGEGFKLSDGIQYVTFAYIKVPDPVPGNVTVISVSGTDDEFVVAAKTAKVINEASSLKITAEPNVDRVTLTADQLGSGKLIVDHVTLNDRFDVGEKMPNVGSGPCPSGVNIGCRSDLDCMSNKCQNNLCQ